MVNEIKGAEKASYVDFGRVVCKKKIMPSHRNNRLQLEMTPKSEGYLEP
jgi:hypothetical protein